MNGKTKINETNYDSTEDTLAHIKSVKANMDILILELAKRTTVHDASKLKEPEKSIFDEMTPKLKSCTYGSNEYKAFLKKMKVALNHHYKMNSHHPEHYTDGLKGFDLCDLIEMFCDWCAATLRHDDGDIGRSININMDRFKYDETLASIFVNTAQKYSMGAACHRAFRPHHLESASQRGKSAQ